MPETESWLRVVVMRGRGQRKVRCEGVRVPCPWVVVIGLVSGNRVEVFIFYHAS